MKTEERDATFWCTRVMHVDFKHCATKLWLVYAQQEQIILKNVN